MKKSLLKVMVTLCTIFVGVGSASAEIKTVTFDGGTTLVSSKIVYEKTQDNVKFILTGFENEWSTIPLGWVYKLEKSTDGTISWTNNSDKFLRIVSVLFEDGLCRSATDFSFDTHSVDGYTSRTGNLHVGDTNGNEKLFQGNGTDSYTFNDTKFFGPNGLHESDNVTLTNGGGSFVVRKITISYELCDTKADMVINNAAPYGTFCCPFDAVMPEGVTAYRVTGWDSETCELALASAAAEKTILPAGTPVIIQGGNTNEVYYGNATVTEDAHSDGYLHGLYPDALTVPANSYVLSKKNAAVKFYKTNGGPGVAYRAYLTLPENASIKSVSFAESATGVKSIENANVTVSSIYSVSGAKSNTMQKGINVVKYSDGSIKKVFVK